MEKSAIVYCRVSSERQKNEGHGLESQEHRCREYARTKGYLVEKIFRDSFTGGGDFTKRPAMSELFKYIDQRPHKNYVVIFDDLSRLARDVEAHIKLRTAFHYRKTELECVNFNFDESPEGKYVELIMAGSAELHRAQNRRQVIQKQKARLEKGYWPFYPPPGYKALKNSFHGKLLTPIQPDANIIKNAFEGFVLGRFKEQVDVQKFLVAEKFRNGKKIYLETVSRLLKRIIYTGYIEYPEWEVSRRIGHHKPIVSIDTFNRVQERLSGKTRSFSRRDTREDFALRGFVICSECSNPLTASWTTKKNKNYKIGYYRCKTKGCILENQNTQKIILDKKFEYLLSKIKPKPAILKLTQAIFLDVWKEKTNETELSKNRLLEEFKIIKEDISKLTKRATTASNEAVIRVYEREIEELSNKEMVLRDKITSLTRPKVDFETALNSVFDFLKNPYSKWINGDLTTKRLFLKIVFENKIRYNKENGFETAELALPLRVFEQVITSKSQGVEMGGVEPPCETATENYLQA
jgi:DNA invertase Pin-like site-specific DNA recombinase